MAIIQTETIMIPVNRDDAIAHLARPDDDQPHPGIAQHLVKGALAMVAAEGGQVIPQCPYVRTYIQRHPAYQPWVAPTNAH